MSNVIQFPVIAGIEIHTDDDGRFNLNALHRASGLGKAKQPSNWLRLDSTKALIDEFLNSSDLRSSAITTTEGIKGGTFANELLAVSYAGWISPRFQLQVNQIFISYKTGALEPAKDPIKLTRLDILSLAIASEKENIRLNTQLDEQKPKIAALELLSGAVGNMCIGGKVLANRKSSLSAC